MKTRRRSKKIGLAMLVLTVVAGVMVGSSTAAKLPKYHVYKTCSDSINCSAAAYLNSSQRSIVTFTFSPKCASGGGFAYSVANDKSVRVSSRTGKFKFTDSVTIQKPGGSDKAVVTIKGKVSRKKKVTASYSVDITPGNCPETKTGKLSMKYKGTQSGG